MHNAVDPASSPVVTSTSTTATTINLTWSQPLGDIVDQYIITYHFTERDCGFSGGSNIMIPVAGSSRAHTLTGVEENSHYFIRITANNAAGNSPPVLTSLTTSIAGKIND